MRQLIATSSSAAGLDDRDSLQEVVGVRSGGAEGNAWLSSARATAAARRPVGGAYAAWLGERDARLPLTRADLYSCNDDTAARIVAAGGGMQAVIEATGLRTRDNVLRLIDAAILERALDNDAARAAGATPPTSIGRPTSLPAAPARASGEPRYPHRRRDPFLTARRVAICGNCDATG
jgi:hypothetical protein